MRNGKIEVQIGATVRDNTVRVLDSNNQVESGVWYYLLIELGSVIYLSSFWLLHLYFVYILPVLIVMLYIWMV